MAIHHDKMAYGKLDSLSEKFSDEKLIKMARLLSAETEEQEEKADENAPAQKDDIK